MTQIEQARSRMRISIRNFLITISFLGIYLPITTLASAADSAFTVLDVRTPSEYNESHIKDSRNIDFLAPDFKDKISKLDKTKQYKIYCRSGNRSAKAIEIMKAQGFKNLENLGSLHEASLMLKAKCDGQGPC